MMAQLERTGNNERPFPASIAQAGMVSRGAVIPGEQLCSLPACQGLSPSARALQGAQHLEEGECAGPCLHL